nr:RNA-directed DNA polymerase, eukaryota, reverse transcriptase zinc-binding domain protein [Tanacetum cinerariifolium]
MGVADEEISHMAHIIGCGVSKLLFKYLGVPVGCNMSRCANWNAVNQIFASRLSCWKARLLSVASRLSLIKAVLDQNDNKMSWVKWERCLASMKKGGLGIGSIYRLNIGLLFKWIWRFLTRPSELWTHVIRSIYGHHGGIFLANNSCHKQTTWGYILSSVTRLKDNGIDLLSLCSRNLGNAGFSVACVRTLVDDTTLKASLVATSWIRNIPIKVNLDVETVNRIFFNCDMARYLWSLLAKWWELDIPICADITDWYDWLDDVRISAKDRFILERVGDSYVIYLEFSEQIDFL